MGVACRTGTECERFFQGTSDSVFARTGPHVAVWLGFGPAWLLCFCQHADNKALQECFAQGRAQRAQHKAKRYRALAGDVLSSRLKFAVRPVKACLQAFLGCSARVAEPPWRLDQVPLPVPAKSPKDAEFIGPYFGSGACVDACQKLICSTSHTTPPHPTPHTTHTCHPLKGTLAGHRG